jgi:hypothetical protein
VTAPGRDGRWISFQGLVHGVVVVRREPPVGAVEIVVGGLESGRVRDLHQVGLTGVVVGRRPALGVVAHRDRPGSSGVAVLK